MKFVPSADGSVIGVRFYKGAGNGGTHTGSLWSSTGTLLASATFTGESSSGWQSVYFGTPVAVTAGTTYVASYYAPNGNYAADSGFFASVADQRPVDRAERHQRRVPVRRRPFPTNSYNSTNYWVDPLFVAAPPVPQPTVPRRRDDGVLRHRDAGEPELERRQRDRGRDDSSPRTWPAR